MNYKQIAVSVSGFQVESKVEALMYPLTEGRSELIGRLSELGLQADCSTGRIMYKDAFKALPLNYTLVFIRHGQTFANQEQNIKSSDQVYQKSKRRSNCLGWSSSDYFA